MENIKPIISVKETVIAMIGSISKAKANKRKYIKKKKGELVLPVVLTIRRITSVKITDSSKRPA